MFPNKYLKTHFATSRQQTHVDNGVARDATSYTFDTRNHGTIEKFNFMRSYGQSLTGHRNDARGAQFTYARDQANYPYGQGVIKSDLICT